MKISSSDCEKESTVQHQFDCFCRMVLRGEASSYHREMARRAERELAFSELSNKETHQLYTFDDYEIEKRMYHIMGFDVHVKNESIAGALDALPEQKRNVILLAYFSGMSDTEIARKMNVGRSTIHHHRTSSLGLLRKLLKEDEKELLPDCLSRQLYHGYY